MERTEIASFLLHYKDRVRSVARRTMPRRRFGVADSEDVFSSVCRRVDRLADAGKLGARTEAELWSLIKTMISTTTLEKSRLIARVTHLVEEGGEYANSLLHRLSRCETDDEATALVHWLASKLIGPEDRQILYLVLRGAGHKVVAEYFGLSEPMARQKWTRIVAMLRNAMEERES